MIDGVCAIRLDGESRRIAPENTRDFSIIRAANARHRVCVFGLSTGFRGISAAIANCQVISYVFCTSHRSARA